MSAAPHPLVVGFGPEAGAARRAMALAAVRPEATLVAFGRARSRPAPAVDPAGLWRWLAGTGDRPTVSGVRTAAIPVGAGRSIPDHALLLVEGWEAWETPLPSLLARRPDLRTVALLAWPTACEWPEYMAAGAERAARRGLDALARSGAMVVLSDTSVAERLAATVQPAGPVLVEPPPSVLAGTFAATDPTLAAVPYVLAAGPLEARANTVLLLQVWRDALAKGIAMPKLVLAGSRGHQIEDIAPLLDWNDALRPLVAEAPGLPAQAMRRLIDNARALLVPDVAGAPTALMRDTRALGTPVIAAATPEARALGFAPLLDPFDGPGWRARVIAAAQVEGTHTLATPLTTWSDYATRILDHARSWAAGSLA